MSWSVIIDFFLAITDVFLFTFASISHFLTTFFYAKPLIREFSFLSHFPVFSTSILVNALVAFETQVLYGCFLTLLLWYETENYFFSNLAFSTSICFLHTLADRFNEIIPAFFWWFKTIWWYQISLLRSILRTNSK